MIAYHFTANTLRDGRPVPVIGEELRHDGEIKWCKSGLYASYRPSQALEFAPGPHLHRVECTDLIWEDGEKFVCRSRTIIASIDVTHLLMRFAADQALSVAHLWDMPPIVRDYLTTLDDGLQDAAQAARDACIAARTAARAAWAAAQAAQAARDAAWAAAWAAARAAWAAAQAAQAARDAAWAAAQAASRDASRDAAWAAQAARDAAWAAAQAASRDAAWAAARNEFDDRVYAAFDGMGE